MKNTSGLIGGFIFGMVGFLVLFKFLILDTTPPSDELAPGMVVLLSIISGVLFALFGQFIQNHVGTKANITESR